ncbi:MAG: hypothetical protein ACE5H9_18435 [Anaerolineae bacterium]
MSFRHELGHLQTLPLALAHAAWLWRARPPLRRVPLLRRLAWLIGALIAHEAAWELAAESYVLARTGREYRRLYRQYPNPWLALFWAGTAGLAVLGAILLSNFPRQTT